jgi:hypothetical protein
MFPSPSVTWTVRQNQMTNGNDPEDYLKAGGVSHFLISSGGKPACRGMVGVGAVKDWRAVSCITCHALRAVARKFKAAV